MQRGQSVYQVLCINTDLCANARREVRGDLQDGLFVARAFAPQAYEVLPEVFVEVVGGVRVGYHDREGGALKLAALKLLEPGGQAIATAQGDETFDESVPLGLCSRIRSARFFGCELLRTTGGMRILYQRIRILLTRNLVLIHHILARWARRLGSSARCCRDLLDGDIRPADWRLLASTRLDDEARSEAGREVAQT